MVTWKRGKDLDAQRLEEHVYPGRILIVDDAPENIRIVANILGLEGYRLAFAQDGETALRMAENMEFDMFLLDIMMPGMDGFQLCEQLKNNSKTSDKPILFLTAKTDDRSMAHGFESGAVDYVVKPVNCDELIARVRTHMELFRSREELKRINQSLLKEISERKQVETELRRREKRYREMAVHDELTHLYNTRYLYKSLSKMVAEVNTENIPFSLIFMDLDNFKRIVDTFGHLNGSRAIAEVAATIRERIKKPAYGVAYGGDEFVVVLPGCGKAEAMEKAEEIRSSINGEEYLKGQGIHVKISASFGVSTYPDDALDIKNLLGQADKAMFDVKVKGKDAVADCRDTKTGVGIQG